MRIAESDIPPPPPKKCSVCRSAYAGADGKCFECFISKKKYKSAQEIAEPGWYFALFDIECYPPLDREMVFVEKWIDGSLEAYRGGRGARYPIDCFKDFRGPIKEEMI
jgi:hypothetical protein